MHSGHRQPRPHSYDPFMFHLFYQIFLPFYPFSIPFYSLFIHLLFHFLFPLNCFYLRIYLLSYLLLVRNCALCFHPTDSILKSQQACGFTTHSRSACGCFTTETLSMVRIPSRVPWFFPRFASQKCSPNVEK